MYKDFDELVKKYKSLLWKFAYEVKLKGIEPEDIYQELLMVLHKCNESFDPKRGVRFISYLYPYLRNRVYTIISNETQKSKVPYNAFSSLIKHVDSKSGILEVPIVGNEESPETYTLVRDILEELDKMPYGFITKAMVMDGVDAKDIAKTLGMSHQYVYKLNLENIKKLKELFT